MISSNNRQLTSDGTRLVRTVCWLATGCVTFAVACAQAAEAIVSYGSGLTTGYAHGGGGFAFSPNTDIAVTALGHVDTPITAAGFDVALWSVGGVKLISVLLTTNTPSLNSTFFQSIPPLLLSAGDTYYLQGADANTGMWVGDANGNFTVGPNIAYLGAASATNYDGSFPLTVLSPTRLLVGPNFQYVTPPFAFLTGIDVRPRTVALAFLASRTESPSFTLLETDGLSGNWRTNLDATLTAIEPGRSYTLTTTNRGTVRFFRIQIP